jgi:hypothetical protein
MLSISSKTFIMFHIDMHHLGANEQYLIFDPCSKIILMILT